MPTPSFVHLRLHSEYSVSDGIVRIDGAVSAALADGMPALGLTDLANMFGMVKFYQEARGKGLKPVIGCDVWIENTVDRDKPFRLLLLCQTRAGYRLANLLKIGRRVVPARLKEVCVQGPHHIIKRLGVIRSASYLEI